jgi:hypothetical protein
MKDERLPPAIGDAAAGQPTARAPAAPGVKTTGQVVSIEETWGIAIGDDSVGSGLSSLDGGSKWM